MSRSEIVKEIQRHHEEYAQAQRNYLDAIKAARFNEIRNAVKEMASAMDAIRAAEIKLWTKA